MSSSQQNASFVTRNGRLGIGIAETHTGMPSKIYTSDNGNSFSSGRKLFFAGSLNRPDLSHTLDKSTFSKSGYNYLGTRKMQSLQNGKPIPNNSSDLYISRKKNLAIGRGSTLEKTVNNPEIKFKVVDKNTVNQAKRSARNSGYIPSRQVANRIHNQTRCC